MASPTLESFCGFLNVSQNQSGISDIQKNDNIFKAYNIVCIISSVLSIAGALIQVLGTSHSAAPSQTGQARSRRTAFETVSGKTQKTIISALAVADVLACFGILFRSALWLGDQELITGHLEDPAAHFDNVFCAVCSAWIHFFFLCTYFWTFSYAIDVYLVVCKINPKPWLYHLLSWGLSLILAFGGILPLYTPFLLK
ncbi:G-protein coupled receptor 143-like [Lingula anatina]|uniref:G-protein coupled receptor 143-like n=1 Tax=Lingula anatina TaxID=7574 RepID=A0A1S3J9V2_LINAN|nr:G-protein coupled receptor 143-like [Lingula anatina]|eukprot:XP_013406991.1 G-protein coupled receptor 143-like [Lingula anatina]